MLMETKIRSFISQSLTLFLEVLDRTNVNAVSALPTILETCLSSTSRRLLQNDRGRLRSTQVISCLTDFLKKCQGLSNKTSNFCFHEHDFDGAPLKLRYEKKNSNELVGCSI